MRKSESWPRIPMLLCWHKHNWQFCNQPPALCRKLPDPVTCMQEEKNTIDSKKCDPKLAQSQNKIRVFHCYKFAITTFRIWPTLWLLWNKCWPESKACKQTWRKTKEVPARLLFMHLNMMKYFRNISIYFAPPLHLWTNQGQCTQEIQDRSKLTRICSTRYMIRNKNHNKKEDRDARIKNKYFSPTPLFFAPWPPHQRRTQVWCQLWWRSSPSSSAHPCIPSTVPHTTSPC